MGRGEEKEIYPIANNIRKILNDRNFTQKALADCAGMSDTQFSLAINGHRPFSLESLSNIAKSLDMRLIDIFTYPDVYQAVDKENEEVTASITVQLKDEKKAQVLRLLFGDKNLKLLDLK